MADPPQPRGQADAPAKQFPGYGFRPFVREQVGRVRSGSAVQFIEWLGMQRPLEHQIRISQPGESECVCNFTRSVPCG